MKHLVIGLSVLLSVLPVISLERVLDEPFECPAATHNLRTIVECGYVTVPEDHAQPDGPQIKLAVATLRSFSDRPAPDPVIFLQGGPGGAAILPVLNNVGLLQLLVPALQSRDLILLDQRGIGLSVPRLGCEPLDDLYLQVVPGSQSTTFTAQSLELLRACHDQFVDMGVKLAAYDTPQNAADVALVAEKLGYEQVNLYGISYGTRLGLTVMRDYPNHVRSAILNSVLPLNVELASEDAANMQQSVEAVFAACTADLLCNWAYPDLESVFYTIFADLNTQPLPIKIEEADDRVFNFDLDGDTLMTTLFYMLYTPRTISAIPSIIYGLNERDASQYIDFVPLPQLSDPAASGSEIMSLSVMCNDFAPFIDRAHVNDSVPLPFQNMGIFNSPRFGLCSDWQTSTPDPLGDIAVHSNIPTLILTGSMDHVTPAVWGERAAATLKNGYVYEFPHQSHGVMGDCADSILTSFLSDPLTPPLGSCSAQERPVQFLITPSGTRRWANYSLILVGSVAIGLSGLTGWRAWKRHHFPWFYSLRITGWLPLAGTALTLGVLLVLPEAGGNALEPFMKARLVETIVPLAMAIQVAFILPPDDEPALEVLMTYPRSLAWLLLERFAVIWMAQGIIAIIGSIVTVMLVDGDVGTALLRWMPPTMLLSGMSLNAALRSRKAVFGVLVAGVIWFTLAFFGAAFLPGQPTTYPLNYVQPLIWPVHAYLQPGDLLPQDYWLNRLFVLAVGLNLVALAVYYVRDSERLLLGKPALKNQRGKKVTP